VNEKPIAVLTREFPPEIYGGGGVHVEFLVAALRRRGFAVDVHCFGAPRAGATAHAEDDPRLGGANLALRVLSADLPVAAALGGAALAHSHTWYTAMAGHWAALLHDIPHVVTAHSLEPRRPWKAEQLGGGYRLSGWAERTAYEAADAVIAVSAAMRADVLDCYPRLDPDRVHVVHNGVDSAIFHPDPATDLLEPLGIDLGRPYVAFVGRLARQKGLPHLLGAVRLLDAAVQLVVLAGAADTPALVAETEAAVGELDATRGGVVLVHGMQPRELVRQVLTHAAAFCCPSVYEPLGIVNLEAMACGTAVVAGAVGGIPEVVVDGVTGTLVAYEPGDPAGYERGLAAAIADLVADPVRAAKMGRAGRRRALAEFAWDAAAARTAALYTSLAAS
jgi:starch synthase